MIKLKWKSKDYVIQDNKLMKARRVVESHYPLSELVEDMQSGRGRLVKLSDAFAGLLRLAGAFNVDDEEVYEGMFADAPKGQQSLGAIAAQTLLEILLPDSVKQKAGEDGPQPNPTQP